MIDDEIARRLAEWAAHTDAVAALWLFGSRARRTARADSDHDFAVELRPKIKDHDWAFADFVCEGDHWKAQLRNIVQSDVSLVGFRDDLPGRFDPRIDGICLWRRGA
ncbi:nucleotidyltransferase domain-containing protein [Bradyrhizobium jicamae]|uniref:nucleotidyltransferase family protein n=1 Tax=Bradyrhizobium jicamae TaxID=280332 RepID=UPI001BAB9154|nr:nucleotidyltransferase domain-containing protein [Bradyrhizobium jicamae]MBR0752727.1 nucleotidyltransferase domain-containing protein [Bradyrhizobium jicamae]